MKKYLLIALLLVPTLLFSSGGVANITALTGTADITNPQSTKKANIKDDLFDIDTLVTYKKTKAQLIFEDKTIVTVGKNSHFSVAEYLNDDVAPEASFKLFNGAVRVITGKIGKISPQKFKVRTKTATIGIRGTNFIVVASDKKGDLVLCTFGEITVKGKSNKIYIVSKGFMARISVDGIVEGVEEYSTDDLDIVLDNAFEFRNLVQLSLNELIIYFDNIFMRDRREDEQKSDDEEPKETDTPQDQADRRAPAGNLHVENGHIPGKSVYSRLGEELVEIPVEETVPFDYIKDEDYTVVDETIQNDSQTKTNDELGGTEIPVYLLGNGSRVTIVDGTNFLNYHQPVSFLIGSYDSKNIFISDSQLRDSRTGMDLYLDPNPLFYASTYDFEATLLSTNYTDPSTNINYELTSGASIKTLDDLDANDEITWGVWNAPVLVNDGQSVSNEMWEGYFVAGNLTPTTVMDDYRQGNKSATYAGSLIGTAYEFDANANILKTDFTGSVSSAVDFGASTIDTTLSYSVNGDAYQVQMNDNINGNQFGGSYGYGAFYGADGKTLGGQFSVDDLTKSRHMTGAYEATTNSIQ